MMKLLTLIGKLLWMLLQHGNVPVYMSLYKGDLPEIERVCYDCEDSSPGVFLCIGKEE